MTLQYTIYIYFLTCYGYTIFTLCHFFEHLFKGTKSQETRAQGFSIVEQLISVSKDIVLKFKRKNFN